MVLNQFLVLAAILFCIGVYGALARKNGVMVLMSIELILNAVNINLVAFSTYLGAGGSTMSGRTLNAADGTACVANQACSASSGSVFALFIIAVAAAEVGVGIALVLMIYRSKRSIDINDMDLLKG